MQNLAIVYGGDSSERDISIITAIQLMNNINKSKYKFYPIIQINYNFYLVDDWKNIDQYSPFEEEKHTRVSFLSDGLYKLGKHRYKKLTNIDCVVLCNHGGMGENGTLQGYFSSLNLCYTSPSVCASAIGMNKYLSKMLFKSLGCNVVDGVLYEQGKSLDAVVKLLGFPLIVKPNCQGSSIGINTAHDMTELREAIKVATQYDDQIIIEKALENFVELNMALIRQDDKIIVSSPEQPLSWQEFLTFEDKYISTGKMSGGGRVYPAKVEIELLDEIKRMATTIYSALDMSGIVRMDFLTAHDRAYINEINTIPGSMAYYLFKEQALDYEDLIDIVVAQSIKDSEHRKVAQFQSNVLSDFHTYSNACKKPTKIL